MWYLGKEEILYYKAPKTLSLTLQICKYEKFSVFINFSQVQHGIIIFNTTVIFYREYKNVPIMHGRSDYFKNFDNNELTKPHVVEKYMVS